MENLKKKIINKYLLKARLNQNKKIVLFFILGLISIIFANFFNNKTSVMQNQNHIDSLIPKGYVLVPINIINSGSISSIIGPYGIVDLYLTKDGNKSKRIASRVKIIKASGDENTYAALLKETQSYKILSYEAIFFAVVQNPKIKSQEIFQNNKRKIVINYQN